VYNAEVCQLVRLSLQDSAKTTKLQVVVLPDPIQGMGHGGTLKNGSSAEEFVIVFLHQCFAVSMR